MEYCNKYSPNRNLFCGFPPHHYGVCSWELEGDRERAGLNPKTLMGQRKVPNLSVIPPAAIVYLGTAMRYGAYEAPKKDGTKGYGPYNWRDQPVEMSTYVDAAIRHLMEFWDGQDTDPISGCHHLAHALATVGILVDAIENDTCRDDRPAVRKQAASAILKRELKPFDEGK